MSQSERFYELLEEMKTTHDAKRHDYASEEDAIQDVLRLSRGMSFKAAISGLE